MTKIAALSLAAALSLLSVVAVAQSETKDTCPCAQLAKARIPQATITAAECIPAGTFTPSGSAQPIADLPAFCRVTAVLQPSPDSHIRIELWLPETGWNERFLGTGTGGGAGYINYASLATGLRKGFATANTDMGTSPGANELTGHPEKWTDFGHRATHEMTVAGKALTKIYYQKAARMAYFSGCSTGGQQALMESQRYPNDYDGILAGAPANNRTHLHTGFVWILRATNDLPSSTLPKQKLDLITRAVLSACAGKDGGAPGDHFLTNPAACHFNPETLPLCPDGTDDSTCLTKSQITALKKIWAGPVNPRTGERIYTPIPLGSENVAAGIDMQQNPTQAPNALFYQYKWAFGKDFDFKTFDFDHDQDRLDSLLGPVLNANSTDLSAFRNHGSKLLMYSGTADPLVPYQDALSYYERVVGIQGGLQHTLDFFRFYLIPGMGHCSGGPGLNDGGDMLGALIKWKEEGIVPQQLTGTAYESGDVKKGVRFRRPVYPYPLLPAYKAGNESIPESYEGVARPTPRVKEPAVRYLK
ncbi:tannase/feruloyl esterase family alpha/beta hydrolase [Dyadobacter sp. CY261]|uniref:tannase/feruloyl esterase family alpha/beta hydrolase n=1 Tax=Dyadobacter sp. CY261 TaxID=2907203 RepID=UPI001F21DDB7|nr:tannase/feruloyl esterase family alpha/beta hydrolase [Dyadobacter sp. CY261]MCF0074984.1 tannase/feruloyl esterase family alpha/beta hydrolase [Dyadobacter sp. CY261]